MNRLHTLLQCFLLLLVCAASAPAQTPPPDPFALHIRAAQAASRAGLPLAAAREYRAALMLHLDDAAACDALAGQLEKAGRAKDALAAYQETIRLQPENAPAHNALAMLLEDAGDTAAAVAQYRQAVALDPNNALLHFNLAAALETAGQLSPARTEYQNALRLKPDFAEAHAALKAIQEGPLAPNNGGIRRVGDSIPAPPLLGAGGLSLPHALALERAGRTTEAIAEFHTVLTHDPANADAHLNLGIALYADGQAQAARREWQRVLTLKDPARSDQARRLLALYR